MSQPHSGYDKKRFQNCTTEEFDCFICTEVSKIPKQCENCEKVFCSQCIDDWFKRQAQCPYRCDMKFKIGYFKNRALERIYNNLNLQCSNCDDVFNIQEIDRHEIICKMPKCQNYDNCRNRINTNNQNNSLSKMYLCSPECQFFLNILNHSSNQRNLYKEISSFMSKNYPNIDGQNGQVQTKPVNKTSVEYLSEMFDPYAGIQNTNSQNSFLTWDPNACGHQIQIKNQTQIILKEQAYIFRSALTKQCFNSGEHYWEIVPDDKSENEMKIGISTKQQFDYNTAFCDHAFGYGFYGIGQLRSGNNAQGKSYGQKFKQSGVLGVYLNMNKGILSFALNGKFFGVAYTDNTLKQGPIYPAIAMLHSAGCTITYNKTIPAYFTK